MFHLMCAFRAHPPRVPASRYWARECGLITVIFYLSLSAGTGFAEMGRPSVSGGDRSTFWSNLISEGKELGLPTQFLSGIGADFVTIEFEDLRSFAAEYHPEHHRMVLNRTLSLNAAGRTLRPLSTLTNQEVATLYHELLHAYLDVLTQLKGAEGQDPDNSRLLTFARGQQRCRYQEVLINPIVQRKSLTELRFLTERESWEALNETWAVFIGWAIWTRLELQAGQEDFGRLRDEGESGWLGRLRQADQEGILVGYYEPENPEERRVTNKRYLASSYRISPPEVAVLLETILEEPAVSARRSAQVINSRDVRGESALSCGNPVVFED